MNKHMPGPWVIRLDNSIETKDGETVASFVDNEQYRNLIAAAPTMYEALKGCLRVTQAWKSQAEMYGDTVEIEAAVMEIKRIKAALAQAEGGFGWS